MTMTAEQCAAQARAELEVSVDAEDAGRHVARAEVWARLAQAAAIREAGASGSQVQTYYRAPFPGQS